MARKTIFVSDISGKEINDKDAAKVRSATATRAEARSCSTSTRAKWRS